MPWNLVLRPQMSLLNYCRCLWGAPMTLMLRYWWKLLTGAMAATKVMLMVPGKQVENTLSLHPTSSVPLICPIGITVQTSRWPKSWGSEVCRLPAPLPQNRRWKSIFGVKRQQVNNWHSHLLATQHSHAFFHTR